MSPFLSTRHHGDVVCSHSSGVFAALALGAAAGAGCQAAIEGPAGGQAQGGGPMAALSPPPPVGDHRSGEAPPADPAPTRPPFEIRRERLRLLPFDTRLSRVSSVTGVPLGDPAFQGFRDRRVELGDSNYAFGVPPDPGWGPAKLVLWVRLLGPVCGHPTLSARYPMLSTDPRPLIEAAHGRPASGEELDTIRLALESVPVAGRASMACLTVLASVEFLVQ